jgi:host factor-I protein
MPDKSNNLQDIFLNSLRKSKIPVTIFLVKGVKLQGIITWFDNFSILLRRDGQAQLIYKHAISTVMPNQAVDVEDIKKHLNADEGNKNKSKQLQDIFLTATQRTRNPVTMFLVNGVMLQGEIATYDLFCLLLQREGASQLVYKHAVSTVQPQNPLNLADEGETESD